MICKSHTVQIFISKIYNKITYVYMLTFFPHSQPLSISITSLCLNVSCRASYHSWVRESRQVHRVRVS